MNDTQGQHTDEQTVDAETAATEPRRAKKRGKRHLIRQPWLRIPLKILLGIVIFILLLPVLIYLPPIQSVLKDAACRVASDATGMQISIGRFGLSFPLDVALDDVLVIDAGGDTMVRAKTVIADVRLRPLLDKDIRLKGLRLKEGYYRMVSADSSLIMTVDAGLLDVDGRSSFDLKTMSLDLNRARLRDADVRLYMDVWKKKITPPDSTAASTPFKIKAGDLQLENVSFAMSMLPTIDTLSFRSQTLTLKDASIDLGTNDIKAKYLGADKGAFTYLTPTAEYIRTHPAPIDTVSPPSPPMTIQADSISLDGFDVLYGIAGAKPMPGFDANYLSLSGVCVSLHDFYNQASTLRVPISRLMARERCGLQLLGGSGVFMIDSVGMSMQDLQLRTPNTTLLATASIPFALMEMKPNAAMSVEAKGNIGFADLRMFMPSLGEYTSMLSPARNLLLTLDASGTLASLRVGMLDAQLPGILSLRAHGNVVNPLKPDRMRGNVDFRASLVSPAVAQRLSRVKDVRIPAFDVSGTAQIDGKTYAADFDMRSSAGDVTAGGRVSLSAERYTANVDIRGLSVGDIMPSLGVGTVTATLSATGNGFNPSRPSAATDITLNVTRADYGGHSYSGIGGTVALRDGVFNIDINSSDPDARLYVNGSGSVDNSGTYTADIHANIAHLDLQALGLSETMSNGNGDIYLQGTANPERWLYDLTLRADNIDWNMPDQYIHLPAGVSATLAATENFVDCRLDTDGVSMDFTSPTGLKSLTDKFAAVAAAVQKQIAVKNIDMAVIQKDMPDFNLHLNAGPRGILGRLLHPQGISVDTVYMNLCNADSLLRGDIGVRNIATESIKLDTVTLRLSQRGSLLDYRTHIGNTPKNMPEFASVNVNGYVGGNRMSVSLNQRNSNGATGYRLGFTAAMMDSVMTLHFTPLKATIAYMPWTFNADNHIDYYEAEKRVDANLTAQSLESSILIHTHDDDDGRNSLHLNMKNIHVQDFLNLAVTAPPLKATIDADVKLKYRDNQFAGEGRMDVTGFEYDRQKTGDFSLGFNADLDLNGDTRAQTLLIIDEKSVMTLDGIVRKEPSPDNPNKFDLILTQLPLSLINPFLGRDVAQMKGFLNGQMEMNGDFTSPRLNGHIAFQDAAVNITMMKSDLRFGSSPIEVTDNVVYFRDFDIHGQNDNPLTLDGHVDASNIADISVDLSTQASNFQLVNNDRRSRADLYGKLFMNLGATVKGPLSRLDVNGNLTVLNTSDIYYTLADSQTALAQQTQSDVVKFVNFADTTAVKQDSIAESSMNIRIRAGLTVSPGTRVTVNLAPTGSNRVQISPSGTINYFQNYMGDIRLTGQLMLGDGYARYTLPVVGEKMFTLREGSYIQWSGPMLNPILYINAYDDMKVNVSDNGNSRLVNFNVSLAVTNTLENPKVAFDLDAEGDMTIENELQSMTPEQRSTQAMNMILYGQYTGPNTKTNSNNLAQSALYSFLTSQINSWAANNIRGVDLSFGVNQYDQTRNGENHQTMSYSYQVSKSLFNNRFKIVVGGNYSTDASADENFSQNLLSDVAFEYMLKQTNNMSMLVKLFRHNDFESILEGEVSEMGVGFVMKRKMSDLKRFFRIRWGKRKPKADNDSTVQAADAPADAPADTIPDPKTQSE